MLGLFMCIVLAGVAYICQAVTVDLTGNWTVINDARGYKIPGSVPGSMYTALYSNKLIPNPLYRDNDVKLRWIGRDDWSYMRPFQLTYTDLSLRSLRLVCDGLDTFSTIYINDQKVGTSENMFVQYVYDIKSVARTGNNTIRIDFQSAVTVAAQKANASSYDIPRDCPAPAQNGECHVNMIRKEQCSFSWNWGPSFPTQGIWKNIYIQGFNSAVIRELSVAPRLGPEEVWIVDTAVYFDISDSSVTGILTTTIEGTSVSMSQPITLTPSSKSYVYSITIPKDVNIERWWPNGYGDQTLYTVKVTLSSAGEVSSKQRRVGFRTVELVQDPVNINQGLTFYFKINNVPVFFKGSNWIPADSFQEAITRDRLRRLLQSAAEAHINSLRVWGGGVYESDDFYDLADELGVMIWQDLMFSDALYPTTPDFLNTVSQEITHQIRRTRHHPCIVVWSGNNENEAGLRENWYGRAHFQRYYDDYVKLYVTTIMTLVNREDSSRVYLPSSPSNGKDTEKEKWLAKDPQSEYYGDKHFYDFTAGHDLWRDSSFPIPRFASEFGVQSWCDLQTLKDVFEPSDLDYWGDIATHRNHAGLGNIQMMEELILQFNEPLNHNATQMFVDLIYLTQINQAMSIRAESEHYRRWQNNVTPDGRGYTMGALYWQLNDIWQAPTWASIDYKGKWKMLHYYAKRFFAPILISPYINGSNLCVYIVVDEIPLFEIRNPENGVIQFAPSSSHNNIMQSTFHRKDWDRLRTKTTLATAGTLYVEMYRWDNFTPLKRWNVTYKCPRWGNKKQALSQNFQKLVERTWAEFLQRTMTRSSQLVFKQDIESMLIESTCPERSSCFLHMYINHTSTGINTSLPLDQYKRVKGLKQAVFVITNITQTSDTEFIIRFESDSVAPFVWLDAGGIPGRFSDNGFLMTSPSREVTFNSWDPTDLYFFIQSLKIQSLMDVET